MTREQLPKNTEPTAVLVAAQSDKLSSRIEKYEEDKKTDPGGSARF